MGAAVSARRGEANQEPSMSTLRARMASSILFLLVVGCGHAPYGATDSAHDDTPRTDDGVAPPPPTPTPAPTPTPTPTVRHQPAYGLVAIEEDAQNKLSSVAAGAGFASVYALAIDVE